MPCRAKNQSNWIQRLELEYGKRPHSRFLTWTYSDEFLPVFSGKANLYKPDLILEIDRLRANLSVKITIFAVGEYGGYLFGGAGERPIHPHYHLMIFSQGQFTWDDEQFLANSFRFGHAHVLETSKNLMSYITGYNIKKLTNVESMNKIGHWNLRPEFIYSSRRPAIGDVVEDLEQIEETQGFEVTEIRINGQMKPLNRYCRLKKRYKKDKLFLDLKNTGDYIIYETRKYFNSLKRREELEILEEEEKQTILQEMQQEEKLWPKIKSDIRRQKIINFESNLKLKSYRKQL